MRLVGLVNLDRRTLGCDDDRLVLWQSDDDIHRSLTTDGFDMFDSTTCDFFIDEAQNARNDFTAIVLHGGDTPGI